MDETIGARKRIGLVAHDNKKRDLAEWAVYNRRLLVRPFQVIVAQTQADRDDAVGLRRVCGGGARIRR